MKEVKIDGRKAIIHEDASIRISVKDTHLCLDPIDITFLYKESKKALMERQPDVKKMKLTGQRTERRKSKRHEVCRRPIAILGPDPVRVGHVTIISDEAAEIQFSENNGKTANRFSELVVLVPDYNNPYLSGKIHVETVSCGEARPKDSRMQSRMRKCVISLDNLNSVKRRQLKSACI